MIPYKACASPICESEIKNASLITGLKTRIKINGNKKIASPAIINANITVIFDCFGKIEWFEFKCTKLFLEDYSK